MRKSTIAAIVIACLLAFCLTSCQSASGKLVPNRTRLAKAHQIFRSSSTYQWIRLPEAHFFPVNHMVVVGDTLSLDNDYYVIDAIDTTKGGGR